MLPGVSHFIWHLFPFVPLSSSVEPKWKHRRCRTHASQCRKSLNRCNLCGIAEESNVTLDPLEALGSQLYQARESAKNRKANHETHELLECGVGMWEA